MELLNINKQFRVALYAIDGVGPALHSRIISYMEKHQITPKEFWVGSANLFKESGVSAKIVKKVKNFKKEHTHYSYYQFLQQKKIRVVMAEDNDYPTLLKQIENHPPLLFVKSKKLSGFGNNPLAVVGTRKITTYGHQVISHLVPDLVQAGFQIISGFMYGVDLAAQIKALEVGGQTTGVLGFGFDHMYPKHHLKIFDEFLEKGASFVTPFAPHVKPSKGTFIARNGIVAGMTLGTLVIEAAARSGSFITARLAGEYGREVMVISGSIFNKYAEGTKKLVNQGAKLIIDVNDILEEVGASERRVVKGVRGESSQNQSLTGVKKEILECLAMGIIGSNDISAKLKKSIVEINSHLGELELDGVIVQNGVFWEVC